MTGPPQDFRTFDVRGLDAPDFRRWLARFVAHRRHDPAFRQRTRIRRLRRNHPHSGPLEDARRTALAADAASPHADRLGELRRQRHAAERAVAGLTDAVARAAGERRSALEGKRDVFVARLDSLVAAEAAAVRASPERQALLAAEASWADYRRAAGLDAAEAELARIVRSRSQIAGRAGDTFEDAAADLIRSRFATLEWVRVLRNVTLGAAGIEFDILVV